MCEIEHFEFVKWNSEQDVVAKGIKPLLPATHPVIVKHTPWAYVINTAIGFYFMDHYTVTQRDVIGTLNGEEVIVTSTRNFEALNFTDLSGTKRLYEDVTVWAHDFFDDFMIVTLHKTDQTLLIDARGIPFELPIRGIKHYHISTIEKNKREGFYLVEKSVVVYYKTPDEQTAFVKKTSAQNEAALNKEFNRFARNNAKNTTKYLYLTAGNSKCGALVRHFISQGMQYEIVPNVMIDDDTVNIRIPLEGANASRHDVQYLCAKYFNTYSIYNIPYDEIGGTLELTRAQKSKHERLKIFFNTPLTEGHETIAYCVINTFRTLFNTDDDYEVYKKVFSKIVHLIERGRGELKENYFSDRLLLYPSEYHVDGEYIALQMDYIQELLEANGYPPWEVLSQETDIKFSMFSGNRFAVQRAYKTAYECSKKRFRQAMSAFEANAMREISAAGGIISKWTSEATLFALVQKEYPDAVFQYQPDWLFLQSLDIYIPSLRVGIEYQGEQHYRPVEIFGGEAGFYSLVERDKRKMQLCTENDVTLIHWKYDEVISHSNLHQKIHEALNQ